MKKAKAYQDGKLVSIMRAEAVTEETRREFDWRCAENGCNCQMHWRKAVHAKGNTDQRNPTFVKNKLSAHAEDCTADIARIYHENIDYTTIKDGQIHVRINFPLGSAKKDTHPLRGYLTEQMQKAIENQRIIQPFSNLGELTKFIEKNLGGLESNSAAELMVNYQGSAIEWHKLFKPSDAYDRLYHRATNYKDGTEEGRTTPPIVTIVRPVRELPANDKGKRRFECEDQRVKILGRHQRVVPVIVCDKQDGMVAKKVEEIMRDGGTMAVAARPFHPGYNSPPSRWGEQRISMLVSKIDQLAPVDSRYWKLSHKPENQLELFPQPSA